MNKRGVNKVKEKKIVFNETIDNAINGYAVAITFIGIGIFLLNNRDYFRKPMYIYNSINYFYNYRCFGNVYRVK